MGLLAQRDRTQVFLMRTRAASVAEQGLVEARPRANCRGTGRQSAAASACSPAAGTRGPPPGPLLPPDAAPTRPEGTQTHQSQDQSSGRRERSQSYLWCCAFPTRTKKKTLK